MIHFPKVGDAYVKVGYPDTLFSLVGLRRYAPTRARQYEEWELELLCVVGVAPLEWETWGSPVQQGKKYYAAGPLNGLDSMYLCLTL